MAEDSGREALGNILDNNLPFKKYRALGNILDDNLEL